MDYIQFDYIFSILNYFTEYLSDIDFNGTFNMILGGIVANAFQNNEVD